MIKAACDTGQVIGASRHGVGRYRFACHVVLPHLCHRRTVESRRRGEFVLRRHRAIVEHRLVQQLEHHRRCGPIGGALSQQRRQRCSRAAARDRQPGGVDAQARPVVGHPVQHGRRIVKRRPDRDLPAPTGSRRRSPCSGRVARTPHTGGDRCRDCPARKPLSGNRSPQARAPLRRGRHAPGSTGASRFSISTPTVLTSRDASARRWFSESRTTPSTLADRSVRAAANCRSAGSRRSSNMTRSPARCRCACRCLDRARCSAGGSKV